mmetsp:Transcript_18255/g.38288  ORF Transcript_18255/g.38288 Transcript_18255/m.38288 type:complete len:183 (-) Transcript_18255:146-694(-)
MMMMMMMMMIKARGFARVRRARVASGRHFTTSTSRRLCIGISVAIISTAYSPSRTPSTHAHTPLKPLGGMQIMPPVKLDGPQLTKLLEDAFFEWGGGGPIDFEDMPSAVMHALMKAALDKLDEVDEVADQVLARARMLRGTLKDSLQHYIAESAHLLSSGAFGALHEAMHHKAGEGRSPTPL